MNKLVSLECIINVIKFNLKRFKIQFFLQTDRVLNPRNPFIFPLRKKLLSSKIDLMKTKYFPSSNWWCILSIEKFFTKSIDWNGYLSLKNFRCSTKTIFEMMTKTFLCLSRQKAWVSLNAEIIPYFGKELTSSHLFVSIFILMKKYNFQLYKNVSIAYVKD